MLRRRFVALSLSPVLALGLMSAPDPAEAATPSSIGSVTAVPGAKSGQITFSWSSTGANTDYFLLETRLTAAGRNAKTFVISAKARTWTMSAAQSASAGAPAGSGNHLYYRMSAINTVGSKSVTKAFPALQAVMPEVVSQQSGGTNIRVATFNVRTVKATKDKRNWLLRVDDVAKEVLTSRAGVVLVQEASPGRADGKGGSTASVGRQTTTLLAQLAKQGGKNYDYKMARTTSYLKSGLPRGTQGGRVMYDNKRYKLLSSCPEKTGKSTHNASCSFKLPILSSDGESKRRRGGYALLQNRSTGKKFWAVSAHFDERHSASKTTGPRYNKLRGDQARYLVSFMNRVNTKKYPVVFGADINTWQNDKSGYAGHDAMVAGGYVDTKSARTRVNLAYTTSNGFDTVLKKNKSGYGSHLDVVMVKGGKGSGRWVNMLQNPDSDRPSDHNLVYADILI